MKTETARKGIPRPFPYPQCRGQGGWIRVKNPGYWRRDQEIASLRRSLERRAWPCSRPTHGRAGYHAQV